MLAYAGTVLAGDAAPKEGYETVSCDVDENYVAFILQEVGDRGKDGARKYVVSFDQGGLAINTPPIAYAPDWADLTRLVFEAQSPNAAIGMVKFGLRKGAAEEVRVIGLVDAGCWQALVEFVQSHHISVCTEYKARASTESPSHR